MNGSIPTVQRTLNGFRSDRKSLNLPVISAEVQPRRIMLLDESELPLSIPLLQLFFSSNRFLNLMEHFIVYQPTNVVPAGESRKQMHLMLKYSSLKIASHTDVECAISLARHDIDEVVFKISSQSSEQKFEVYSILYWIPDKGIQE